MSFEENYDRVSPCSKYRKKITCAHILNGNATNYFWNAPEEQCKQSLQSFSMKKLVEMMHAYGNIMIVGDSMNELFFDIFRNAMVISARSESVYNIADSKSQCAYDTTNNVRSFNVVWASTGMNNRNVSITSKFYMTSPSFSSVLTDIYLRLSC